MNQPLIEGCVDSYASAMAAAAGGADRLELCANLAIGGTTPSPALFKQVQRDCAVKINVLIRPRFGDFLYSQPEMEEMCTEVQAFRTMGANGVVIGALTPEGMLDTDKMRRLMDCAGEMEVTLHRAFDMARDPMETLEAAAALGCRTILTSGQASGALAGLEVLRVLRARAAGRIDIMAGCGVKKENIRAIFDGAGITSFHTTGRGAPLDSGMVYRKAGVSMGLPSLSEYEVWRTDPEEFRSCAEIVHGLL
ncbi:MAG: copper homeostasis protein CutC [Oscillibacter sp.]|jgi:copper homeostasis protein|nr:copper homeostasis protein CutC [uncultured Oscillibacter sp.]MCI8812846.1 copper homeostasis protein CutC [Oscillibacter sp.]